MDMRVSAGLRAVIEKRSRIHEHSEYIDVNGAEPRTRGWLAADTSNREGFTAKGVR
jgi:hypothetical protein